MYISFNIAGFRGKTKLGKEYVKVVYYHLAYLTYMKSTSWETELDKAQVGIKFAERNINNLRYSDNTNFMAERKEELKSLLMKMKEESEKAGLKLHIQETKIMALSHITSWQIDGETIKTVTDFLFLGSKITVDGDCSHEIKATCSWKKSYDQPRQHIKKQTLLC